MSSALKALIIFMRYPEPGMVKSRLAAVVGKDEACSIYQKLARFTLGVAADVQKERRDVHVWVYFTPEDKKHLLEQSYPGPWRFAPQRGEHLGERMGHAVQEMLGRGYRHVLVVGTDIVDLKPGDFHDALNALEQGYAVLGPAADGGFYCIGLDRPCPSAFAPETWGTDDIFARTERLMRSDGLRVSVLDTKQDVDRPADLPMLEENIALQARLSIIIPTLEPIRMIEERLLVPLRHRLWPDDEIIVVRGQPGGGNLSLNAFPEKSVPGKPPGLPEQIWAHGPKVFGISSPMGRGVQLNTGARAAKGDILLFLHADCMPPPNALHEAREIAGLPRMSLGCFHLSFHPPSPPMNLIARWANIRTHLFKLPYGDQGLFCRREIFERMGGFKNAYLMEDVDLVKRSRQYGNLLICDGKMLASPHRYLSRGVLRTSMLNHTIMLLYHLGVADRKLYSLYYRNHHGTARG